MHKVKCKYCSLIFDADKEPYVYIESSRRYAHKECYEKVNATVVELTQNEKDYLELEAYLNKKFGKVSIKAIRQVKNYKDEYGYTYRGIYNALHWWFDITKHPVNESIDGIGIIPFIYEEASRYFEKIRLAQEGNSAASIKKYAPKIREIIISPPSIETRSNYKEFKLLDEEE